MRKEEEYEHIVAKYVRDHPKVSTKEVCEATGIKERIIARMLKSGRLVGADVSYPCKSCGEPIFSGSYCNKCSLKMQKKLEEARLTIQKTIQSRGKGMYSKNM